MICQHTIAAILSAEKGVAFFIKHDFDLHQLQVWSWKAEAQILSSRLKMRKNACP
jgi:hypothetical protein